MALFLTIQTLAKLGNSAKVTPVSTATKQCTNVYNSFYIYAGPNKKIETILQEVKKQLNELQDDMEILKGNKSAVKGKQFRSVFWANMQEMFLEMLNS